MEKFSARYVECNPTHPILLTPDAAYVLAFSMIMLNTDLHNPGVKNKMSKKVFVRNNLDVIMKYAGIVDKPVESKVETLKEEVCNEQLDNSVSDSSILLHTNSDDNLKSSVTDIEDPDSFPSLTNIVQSLDSISTAGNDQLYQYISSSAPVETSLNNVDSCTSSLTVKSPLNASSITSPLLSSSAKSLKGALSSPPTLQILNNLQSSLTSPLSPIGTKKSKKVTDSFNLLSPIKSPSGTKKSEQIIEVENTKEKSFQECVTIFSNYLEEIYLTIQNSPLHVLPSATSNNSLNRTGFLEDDDMLNNNPFYFTFFNPDREGWLYKCGGRIKTWKRRYAILTGSCLYYFKKEAKCMGLDGTFTTADGDEKVNSVDESKNEKAWRQDPCGILPLENLKVEIYKPNTSDRPWTTKECFYFRLITADQTTEKESGMIKAAKTDGKGRIVEGKTTLCT